MIPRSRPQTLELGNYLVADNVNLPKLTNRREKAADCIKRMFCNDTKGCCVISSKFHGLGLVSAALNGTPILGTDAEVLSIYRYFSPWDTGCNMAQVLDYMKATGIKMGGSIRKIDGYVAVNYTSKQLIMASIDLIGYLAIGMSLCNDWYSSNEGDLLIPNNSRIVGGHEMCGYDYDEEGVIAGTWAGTRKIRWDAMTNGQFIDELYVPLLPEWYNTQGVAVSGINVADLRSDLDKIGGGTMPPISAPPVLPFDWS